jgi:hypothetical protein
MVNRDLRKLQVGQWMDKPLGCPYRIVVCLNAGNHFKNGSRRVFLENPAGLYVCQINLNWITWEIKDTCPH